MLIKAATEWITFPNLGFEIDVDPELFAFTLFGHEFSIKWYGLLIAVGFLLAAAYFFARVKRMKRPELDPDRVIDVALVSTIFAFIGARLYYVLFSGRLSEYFEKPLRILNIAEGGLAIYGGLLAAFLTALWMCRLRKVDVLRLFDFASLSLLIGQCVGRWGNFINQEAFGTNTDLPWAMSGSIIAAGIHGTGYDTALPVHPTFLYESLWCLLGFVVLHIVSCKAYKYKGQLFSLYMVWYGTGRFFIESLRTDSLYLYKTIRVSQLLAILSVLAGCVLLYVFYLNSKKMPRMLPVEEEKASAILPDAASEEERQEPDAGRAAEEPAEAGGVQPDAPVLSKEEAESSLETEQR
ncbi:MAG: prolipoprotein diacylglyceryl transferase [Clostridia bacterium]|nr:prolipoprotein diacylglyceryl transferase [Clostridia bacterium]